MQEYWKEYPYEQNLLVSNLGNVKRINRIKLMPHGWCTIKDRNLKIWLSKGYREVSIKNQNNKKQHLRVCRLVAITFIANPENKPQVNHIDGSKENDKLDNLE